MLMIRLLAASTFLVNGRPPQDDPQFFETVATERPWSSENQIKFVVLGLPRPRPIACQGRPRPRRLGPSELGRGGLTVSDSIQTELTPLTLLI